MPSSKDTKRSKAPKIILPGTRRGSRLSATAPRKMSRSSPKAAPLAPGDPSATNTATYPGPNGLGNTIETNTNYTMGQEDRCVLVVQNPATIGLSPEPLLGYPIYIVADGGAVTVTGSIQGGTQTIPQGSIGVFVYSSISGEWSSDRGVGSAGSTGATGATGPAGVTGITGATGAAAPANAFVQGGNAFGATGVFGLTDANGLKMVTNSGAQFGYFALGGSDFLSLGAATVSAAGLVRFPSAFSGDLVAAAGNITTQAIISNAGGAQTLQFGDNTASSWLNVNLLSSANVSVGTSAAPSAGTALFRINGSYIILQGQTGTPGTQPGIAFTNNQAADWAFMVNPTYNGTTTLAWGEQVTSAVILQAIKSGTGANAGVTMAINAQGGQAQTGSTANNNGGILALGGGPAGTGGSGAAATSGAVQIVGGQRVTTRTIASPGTVDSTATSDFQIFCNFSAAGSVTLPVPTAGRVLRIKDIAGNAGTDNITVTPNTGTIDGSATYVLNINKAGVELTSDGTNWFVTAEYNGTVI